MDQSYGSVRKIAIQDQIVRFLILFEILFDGLLEEHFWFLLIFEELT